MKRAYEFDKDRNLVTICTYHTNAYGLSRIEAQARKTHPGAVISHGICDQCIQRERDRMEIAAANEAIHKLAGRK